MVDTPWVCLLANESYPYVDTPVFIIEAQTDEVVLLYHDWVPQADITSAPVLAYINEWKRNMTSALQGAVASSSARHLKQTTGVFNPACLIHTSFNTTVPSINNLVYTDVLRTWYSGGAGPTVVMDDCGVFCGHCPSPPPSKL
jgi:hypothetical protein